MHWPSSSIMSLASAVEFSVLLACLCEVGRPRRLAKLIQETGFSKATMFSHLAHLEDIASREIMRAKRKGQTKHPI